jgi:hypothetical protein
MYCDTVQAGVAAQSETCLTLMRSVHEVGLLCKFQALTAASGCLGTRHPPISTSCAGLMRAAVQRIPGCCALAHNYQRSKKR